MTACTRSARTGYARGPDSVPADVRLLFATRLLRLFAFGMVSITLALYLAAAGFGEGQIGLLVSLTLAGDAGLSLWITTRADRLGRRRMLRLSAGLMALAGVTFALTDSYWLLLLAAIVGTLSPSGNEVGSFLPIEQASLAQTVSDGQRTAGRSPPAASRLPAGVYGVCRAGIGPVRPVSTPVAGRGGEWLNTG